VRVEVDLPPEVIAALVVEVKAQVLAELRAERTEASPYLTVPEAAVLMRCSRGRVDDLLSQGRLTRYKDGRRTLVLRREVEDRLRDGGHRP
jgi:excisionase family DNA binding protein